MATQLTLPVIKILIVDDHPLYRLGLRLLLSQDPGMSVVGEAKNGAEALALIPRLHPDVVFMDLILPGPNGIDTTRQISRLFPHVRTIILTGVDGIGHIALAIQAGAQGYLVKNGDTATIHEAVQAVMKGEIYVSPGVSGERGDTPGAGAAGSGTGNTFQKREILDYILSPVADHPWTKPAASRDNNALGFVRILGNKWAMRGRPTPILSRNRNGIRRH